MNTYQRVFGTGPRGLLISGLLLGGTWYLAPLAGLPSVHGVPLVGGISLAVAVVLTAALVGWSLKSLPVEARGQSLIVGGAFHYFRHPLYAAFLLFFNFGLALWFDNALYLVWALAQHPVWHLNIRGEEALMRDAFPGDYEAYCETTGRFFPRLRGLTR
jgi:protein-S-isoprenylcysteine O-methyltransferase Ste14